MKYSVLGTTGVKVSRICLGTATFGVAPTAQDADRVVARGSCPLVIPLTACQHAR